MKNLQLKLFYWEYQTAAKCSPTMECRLSSRLKKMKTLPIKCPCEEKVDLRESENGFTCTNTRCLHSNDGQAFSKLNHTPILISEVRCDTICKSDQISSYVARPFLKYQWLKEIALGRSKTTHRNCHEFVRILKENDKNPKVLVIGSGEKGNATSALWKDPTIEIHGVDIYLTESVDVVCDAHYLPLGSNYYDGVWIQAVLEHVVEPGKVVDEIYRVLKQGGVVYAETPFMQQVHEGAYDFTRYTVLGHRFLFRKFAMIEIGGNKGPETVLTWSLRYFVWSITRSKKIARFAGLVSGIILRPFGWITSKTSMFDASSGVFFLGYKNPNVKLSHKDLIDLYKGQFK